MNLLIIGGLLTVGVLAILGAVLLSISEQRAEVARRDAESQAALPASGRPTVRLKSIDETGTRQLVATETTLANLEGEQAPSKLNGQFHELAGEIRSLHQQAQSLEQRLGVLTEMVDLFERSQDNHISIEEEAHRSTDNTVA